MGGFSYFDLNNPAPENTLEVDTLIAALQTYGIDAEYGYTSSGPRIARHFFKMPTGAKVSKLTRLGPELTVALAAPGPIMVVAPILNTPYFAIDVPRHSFDPIRPLELWSTPQAHALPVYAGFDMAGEPLVVDLKDCHHLMVAGSTGSGKSVFVHAVLCGLLANTPPEAFKLALVDFKQVELSAYSSAPNLLLQTATDAPAAIRVLHELVRLMELRYTALKQAGYTTIYALNEAEGYVAVKPIVCVIDELADVMQGVYRSQVEELLTKLLQKARGAGIHFIISVQRPCAKAVAGTIKANITSRVAFRTASAVDSRVILDCAGAEHLSGKGDGLFRADVLGATPVRFQAPFLTSEEIDDTVQQARGRVE